ncbi:hypothetical protein [Halovenus marina]|uniref:hypothetical protein n=1 Tax=Halovenus marina TaxID=3396621 RepID=UPI003F569952
MSLSSAGLDATAVSHVRDSDRVRDYDELTERETRAFHRVLDGQPVRDGKLIESLSNSVIRFTKYYRIKRR